MGIPTEAGLPHAFGNAFRNVAALVADIDFTFKEVPKETCASVRSLCSTSCICYILYIVRRDMYIVLL